MNILDFVACALAASAIVTAWFYGSIFEKRFAYFEKRKEESLLAELLTCLTCFPYHAAFWTIVILWLPGVFLPEPWTTISRVPLYAFALTTLIHYVHKVLPIGEADDDVSSNRDAQE